MKIAILDTDQNILEEVELNTEIFGREYRDDIVHRVVAWQLDKARSGCHKVKVISEVSGGGRKPYKQKGTGRARQGSIRSPQFKGGAKILGPVVRSHAYKLNKKVRALGLKIALSRKYTNDEIKVFNEYKLPEYKTKVALKFFEQYESVLVVGDFARDEAFLACARNIAGVKILDFKGVNVYDLVKFKHLFISKECLDRIQDRLS